ncbi:hypothetical protein [Changchengzhania lutea]|uniref:hypothetical protein n=1 Tax=Changchengzhania lutea TaxID=2049305 RepID=UPI00163D8E21|nr:hypothetical protein [Changchengzhania lutea]
MTSIKNNLQNQIDRNSSDILANSSDIQYLQEFMYGKMSSKERMHAINNGFFDMDPDKREEIKEQLEMEIAREQIIQDMGMYLNSASDILNIASNLGFDSPLLDDVGKLVQAGDHILKGVAALSSPMGYLSAASSFSNVLSIGKPDAGATRHKQIMKTLGKILKNQHEMKMQLNRMEQNQLQILEGQKVIFDEIVKLGEQIKKNHNELLHELRRIREDIYISREGITELIRRNYKLCYAPLEDAGGTFDKLNYKKLNRHFRKWNKPTSNNILPCTNGLNSTISFGGGVSSNAFKMNFDMQGEDRDKISEFLNGYWSLQVSVMSQILEEEQIGFNKFFLMSLNPNYRISNIEQVYNSDIEYITPERLSQLEEIINSGNKSIFKDYYSPIQTLEIAKLFKEYFVFYETVADDGKSLKKVKELAGYNEENGALGHTLSRMILHLDILIFQQNLISGSALLPHYYNILLSENEALKSNILKLFRLNSRLKSNFIKYVVLKQLKKNNTTSRMYHFSINSPETEDSWLLLKSLGSIPNSKFVWKDNDYLKLNKLGINQNWFLKLMNKHNDLPDDILLQLPTLIEIETGHLSYTNEIFEAIEMRNTLLDNYYGMNINKYFNRQERQLLTQTLISN